MVGTQAKQLDIGLKGKAVGRIKTLKDGIEKGKEIGKTEEIEKGKKLWRSKDL